MAVTAQFTEGVSYLEDPAIKARLEVIAEREGISLGRVLRDVVRKGIEAREAESEALGSTQA